MTETSTHTLTTGWYVFRANATHLPPLEGRFSLAETANEAADAWEADDIATEVAFVNVAEADTTDYSNDDDERHPDDELCEECSIPAHDTCGMVEGANCPCCDDTWRSEP